MSSSVDSVTFVRVGRKLYGRCMSCGKVVQANKRLLGSLHRCETPGSVVGQDARYAASSVAGPES